MKNYTAAGAMVSAMLMATACTNDTNALYATDVYCNFSYYVEGHVVSDLATAVQADETYALVTTRVLQTGSNPPYNVETRLYGQAQQSETVSTALECQRPRALGLSNGLIVGKSIVENMLLAYDLQCANCYETTLLTNAALTWAGDGHTVKCARCNRSYNLSNGGVVSSGESGRNLYRYRVTYDGRWLNIHN